MEIVISCFAFALFALTVYHIEKKIQKTKKMNLESELKSELSSELDKNQRAWESAAINKKSINILPQEGELGFSDNEFNESGLIHIEEMLRGSGLKIRDIRNGAYVADLLGMYKDLTIGVLDKDDCEEKILNEITIVKNPKDYWDCYMNLDSAVSLVLGEIYTKILTTHIDTLARKRKQLMITDDYGYDDCEQWISEKKRFIKNIATPYISKEFNSHHDSNFRLLLKFIEGPNNTEMPDFTLNTMDYYIDKILSTRPKKDETTFNKILTGQDYEHYVASIFKKHNWSSRVTKYSGDQGADIVATKKPLRLLLNASFTRPQWETRAYKKYIQPKVIMMATLRA